MQHQKKRHQRRNASTLCWGKEKQRQLLELSCPRRKSATATFSRERNASMAPRAEALAPRAAQGAAWAAAQAARPLKQGRSGNK